MKHIIDRIGRAEGQLSMVKHSIQEGDACEKVLPQLLAVKGAVDAVVRLYIEETLDTCALDADTQKAKKIIKTLIKHS